MSEEPGRYAVRDGRVESSPTRFVFAQRVRIHELETSGRVLMIVEDGFGVTYKVRYFHNGDEKTAYFFPDELSSA